MASFARGQRLGPYETLESIGAGGMGEVWKARDTRLDRIVAIKISKEQFSERFDREAHAVAALNHPHICTLHDVGPNYLWWSSSRARRSKARCRSPKLSSTRGSFWTRWMPRTARASRIAI